MEKDNNLEVDISQLEIAEDTEINVLEENVQSESTRRSSRKKIHSVSSEKRRVQSKPKRMPNDPNSKAILNYYLDKKIKRNPTNLETIFEDPMPDNILMSRRKYSRSLQFLSEISDVSKNKHKVKKRSMKAKQKGNFKRKKLTMDLLLEKLASLENDDETI